MAQSTVKPESAIPAHSGPSRLAEPPQIDKSEERVRRMFASIAHRYDFLNHFLSLNIDRSWRRFTTRTVPPRPGEPVLDCCTGTADLALAYDRAAAGHAPVVATDFCRAMLDLGRDKVHRQGAGSRIILIEGDTQRLPVPAEHVRRGQRRLRPEKRPGHRARHRRDDPRGAPRGARWPSSSSPGPRSRFLGRLYLAFFRHILPRVGQALSPNSDQAYHYLPRTVLQFPDGQEMLDLLAARGLIDLKMHPLTLGIATLYVGTKPVPATRPAEEPAV